MKKIISLLLTVSLILSFTACSDRKTKTDVPAVSEESSGRTVVTIGTVGELNRFPTEYEFNLSQNNYRFQIKDYSKIVDNDDDE